MSANLPEVDADQIVRLLRLLATDPIVDGLLVYMLPTDDLTAAQPHLLQQSVVTDILGDSRLVCFVVD
jgi:hypothetical protein